MNAMLRAAVATVMLCAPAAAAADSAAEREGEPLWEVGAFGVAGFAPDYPAASEGGFRWLAGPLVVYRGDFLRLGERDSFIRGVFFDSQSIEFDISLSGSFPADSDDNDARRGMPDLDWLGEIGPQVKVKLGEVGGGDMELRLPIRAAFSTDLGRGDFRGFVFHPKLFHRFENVAGDPRLGVRLSAGATFATERLHDYFYEVDPEFVTASREEFDADGGYLGSDFTVGASYRVTDRVRLFGGAQLNLHTGAANEDSPLFRDEATGAVFTGFSWSFYQSEERVFRGE